MGKTLLLLGGGPLLASAETLWGHGVQRRLLRSCGGSEKVCGEELQDQKRLPKNGSPLVSKVVCEFTSQKVLRLNVDGGMLIGQLVPYGALVNGMVLSRARDRWPTRKAKRGFAIL